MQVVHLIIVGLFHYCLSVATTNPYGVLRLSVFAEHSMFHVNLFKYNLQAKIYKRHKYCLKGIITTTNHS
jgi:hypothetical protein